MPTIHYPNVHCCGRDTYLAALIGMQTKAEIINHYKTETNVKLQCRNDERTKTPY